MPSMSYQSRSRPHEDNIHETIKVNLGCGRRALQGWINYDSSIKIQVMKYRIVRRLLYFFKIISKEDLESQWPRNVIRRDLRKSIPLKDNSVDYIYCSHMLEHLLLEDARKLIREAFRVLKPGGWMRIVVPDLKLLATKYVEEDLSFFNAKSKGDLAGKFIEYLRFIDKRPFWKKLLDPYHPHRMMYDFDLLKELLINCGFKKVEKRAFQQGIVPDINLLDHLPHESLYVEAQK